MNTNKHDLYCQDIASELMAIYNGEIIADDDENYYEGLEQGDTVSLWDYILGTDFYNIDYIVGSDRETLKGVRLMVACGGPNVYINTWDNEIQLHWWSESGKAWLPHEVCEEINDIMQEYWNC